MTNTCKNCRHWGNNRNGEHYSGRTHKTCDCPAMRYGYGRKLYESLKPDEVHIEADEGWGMTTGPDFGCIHFSQREAAK